MSSTAMRWGGPAAVVSGCLSAILFSALALVEAGKLDALDVIETHWFFHILQAPMYAMFVLGALKLRRERGPQLGRLGRFGTLLVIIGASFGTLAGAIVPFVELVLGEETGEGALDAVFHTPEFIPFIVGTALLGIAILISAAVARQHGLLLVIGAVSMFMVGPGSVEGLARIIPMVVFGLAWAYLGSAMLSERSTPARRAALAS